MDEIKREITELFYDGMCGQADLSYLDPQLGKIVDCDRAIFITAVYKVAETTGKDDQWLVDMCKRGNDRKFLKEIVRCHDF